MSADKKMALLAWLCIFQADDSDLFSIRDAEMVVDVETEQLITEIEELTSRALEETQQWKSTPSSGGGNERSSHTRTSPDQQQRTVNMSKTHSPNSNSSQINSSSCFTPRSTRDVCSVGGGDTTSVTPPVGQQGELRSAVQQQQSERVNNNILGDNGVTSNVAVV